MRVESDRSYEGPLPAPDGVAEPFWRGAAEGRLLYQRCSSCDHAQFYPRALCTRCGETPEWEQASGRGAVHTFTIVRQMGARPFRDRLPYVVAMIELVEGVRMMGNVTDCAVEDVRIGMPVEAYALPAELEGIGPIAVPFWRPSGGHAPGLTR
ncbi:MAG: Zn-ribbon domain-containing OB-fold protein [Myxococcota bacterium]